MVHKLAGRHHRHREYLTVARPGLRVRAMIERAHHIVNDHKDRYNHVVGHRSSLR